MSGKALAEWAIDWCKRYPKRRWVAAKRPAR